MSRLPQYLAYHHESLRAKDIDPSYAMLRYVCDRFELNIEQRYWLAFVYAMTYCGASTFYVYNEFPDYENLDSGRLNRWWDSRGRAEIICQTDRRWVRSSSLFVPAVESYRRLINSGRQWGEPDATQHKFFSALVEGIEDPRARYDKVYKTVSPLYSFGQFSLFLYLEALHTITPMDFAPTDLDLDKAWSCRDGLCYAYGLDQFIGEREAGMPKEGREPIGQVWKELKEMLLVPRCSRCGADCQDQLCVDGTDHHTPVATNIWQIETTLCAYKKFHRGKRYLGYYVDRQALEIAKMQRNVPDGVAWDVLWDFRRETYDNSYLVEEEVRTKGFFDHLKLANKGLPTKWLEYRKQRTYEITGEAR